MRFNVQQPFRTYHCEPGWSWTPVLADFDLWCVLSGAGEMRLNAELVPLRSGSCFLLRPGDSVRAIHDPKKPLTVFAGHFIPSNSREMAQTQKRWPWTPGPVVVPDLETLQAAVRMLLFFQNQNPPDPDRLQSAFDQLLALVDSNTVHKEQDSAQLRLRTTVENLQSKLGHLWDVAEMSRLARMSRAQLNRVFQQAYQCSPTQFLLQKRVERARELLRESEMSLDQIAESLGFADVHHFSRRFHQETGVRPGAYRRDCARAALRYDSTNARAHLG